MVAFVAGVVFLVGGATRAEQQNQQQARVIIERMVAALGGNAYLGLEDAESEGRSGSFYQGSSVGSTPFHRFSRWPDKDRVELGRRRDVVELTIGEAMYEITFRGSRPIDPQKDQNARIYLARENHALQIVLRRWLEEAGTALFYEGPALAENHAVDRVTIINSQENAVTILIDSATHLPVKDIFVIRDPQTKDRDEISEVFDNWKIVQGINTPFNTLVSFNGELRWQYYISSISYNQRLPDSLFSLPGPPPFTRPVPR